MEDFVVGEGSLEMHDLSKLLEKSDSFVMLVQNWKTFGQYVGISDVKLLDLERRLKLGDLQLENIPREILKIWKAEKGNAATLKVLHEALVGCGVQSIADSLLAKFWEPASIRKVKFLWHNKIVTLDDLLGENTPEEIHQRIFKNLTKKQFPLKPFQLFKAELLPPAQPSYYIPRTLLHFPASVEVDNELFSSDSTKDHVFLFKGLRKSDLVKLIGFQAIDESGNQLDQISVKFIILECDGDYDRICKITRKPVHMIENKDGRYFWIKSNRDLCKIQPFLKSQGEAINEDELASLIMSPSKPCSISIGDSPGMGKTLLLSSLARKIQENESNNAILLYIVLPEFVCQIYSIISPLEVIAEYSSNEEIAKLVLVEMMKTGNVYLFFDGYDEVMQDKLDLVDSFLMQLQELKNIKVIVTTRPHLRRRLEDMFSQFAYEILPFNENNQNGFLMRYWITKHGAKDGMILKDFASLCLETLATNLTDGEKEIAGIPLQCMMFGEVYAENAIRASRLDSLRNIDIKPMSFLEMYRRLIEHKFSRILGHSSIEKYQNAHVYDAITLLFPEWVEEFKSLLKGRYKVEDTILYSIGLIEKSPQVNTPRFIHRTFAEYLLAEFIVKNLRKHKACIKLLFGEILGKNLAMDIAIGRGFQGNYYYYAPNRPVIAYFIELHLRSFVQTNSITELLPSKHLKTKSTKFDDEDLCAAVVACCSHDLENCFDFATRILQYHQIGKHVSKRYFKGLPYAVIGHTKNLTLLEKALNFSRTISSGFLNRSRSLDLGTNAKDTPLHMAAFMGKYNMVTYLVQKYGNQVSKFENLIHACVEMSRGNSDSVIEDKLLIIDLLTTINSDWLNARHRDCTPLLQNNVHLSLLQRLVENGADINAYSSKEGTVLHKADSKNSYADHVRWAIMSGFRLLNQTDCYSKTPLMRAIQKFETVDDETLKLLSEAGADFNGQDECGNSVLFYALKWSNTVAFISKVLEYGANVNHRNNEEENAAHIIIRCWKRNTEHVVKVLKLLESKGFSLFNMRNSRLLSPLDLARERNQDTEILTFLDERLNIYSANCS